MTKQTKIIVNGLDVSVKGKHGGTYISLTDIARLRNEKEPRFIVYSWLKNRATVSFLGLWETLNNPDFKRYEFDTVKNEAGDNAFSLTPKEWQDKMNGIGIVSVAGKYESGIFAHEDIAMEFASWVSPEFKLYLIQEFKRLKVKANEQLAWDAKRELAKINYHIQTDAIKENLIAPSLTERQKTFVYADEADLLNVALFGLTSKEWREQNPEKTGNVRDYASVHQLLVLANMESFNAVLIAKRLPQIERLIELNNMARQQLRILMNVDNKLLLPNYEKTN